MNEIQKLQIELQKKENAIEQYVAHIASLQKIIKQIESNPTENSTTIQLREELKNCRNVIVMMHEQLNKIKK